MELDEITEQFIADTIHREHNRLIAKILGDLEAFTGAQNPKWSKDVKDIANMSKRVMFTKLTKTEVESKYGGGG